MGIIKKITSVLVVFIFGALYINAQPYVSGGLGYGIPATPEPFGLNYNFELEGETTEFRNRNIVNGYGNAGQGFRVNGAFGYKFNENFGVELGVYYFTSPQILVQDTIQTTATGDNFYNTYTQGWHLRLTPALVFMAGNGPVTPYAKFGLCLPVAGLVNIKRESNDPLLVNSSFSILNYSLDGNPVTADKFDLEAEFKGQFSLGFESVAGVDYQLNDNLSIFGEVALTMLRIRRATSEVTKGIATMSNGDEYDVLPLLSLGGVYQHTDFVDEVDLIKVQTAMNEASDVEVVLPNGEILPAAAIELVLDQRVTDYGTTREKAHQLLVSDGAYNAIGINFGVRFSF